MNDFEDDVHPSGRERTTDEIAAGLDLTSAPTFSNVEMPGQTDARIIAQNDARAGLEYVTAGRLGLDLFWGDMLTGQLVGNAAYPTSAPVDPDYSLDRHRARLEEASKTIPPEWLWTLSNARSDVEFENLVQRAQFYMEAERRLTEAGWPWHVARFASAVFDPVSFVAGGLVGGAGVGITRATAKSTVPWVIGQALSGAAGAVTPDVIRKATANVPVDDETFLYAAGIGLVLGGAVGAATRNPNTALESSILARVGSKMKRQVEERIWKKANEPERPPTTPREPSPIETPPAPKAETTPAPADDGYWGTFSREKAARAGEAPPETPPANVLTAEVSKTLDELEANVTLQEQLARARFTPLDPAMPTIKTHLDLGTDFEGLVEQTVRVLRDREPGLQIDDVIRQRIAEAIDNIRRSEAPPPDNTPKAPPPGMTKLEDVASDLKNPRYIARWSSENGVVYRVMAQTEDVMGGPYVIQEIPKKGGNPKIVARDLDHLAQVKLELEKLAAGGRKEKGVRKATRVTEVPKKFSEPVEPGRLNTIFETPDGPLEVAAVGDGKFLVNRYVRPGTPGVRDTSFGPVQDLGELTREEVEGLLQDAVREIKIEEAARIAEELEARSAASLSAAKSNERFLDEEAFEKQLAEAWQTVTGEDVPRPWWGRFDRAGLAARSQSPITRWLGPYFMNDPVGRANHAPTPFSAYQAMRKQYGEWLVRFYQYYRPALDEYIAKNPDGSPRGAKVADWGHLKGQFNIDLAEYIAGRNPMKQFHPAVSRAAQAAREVQEDALRLAKNPRANEGGVGRPLPGAEDVVENQSYLWRKFDDAKVRGAINQFGEKQLEGFIQRAILKAQPDIDKVTKAGLPPVSQRMAKGYLKGVLGRALGREDEWALSIGEGNRDKLLRLMQEEGGLSLEEATAVADNLVLKRQEPGMENLKRRVLLAEDYGEALPLRNAYGKANLGFRDLLVNDGEYLLSRYLRRFAGRIALAKVQVNHPTTGEVLVDGITSRGEFDRFVLKPIRDWYADRGLEIDSKRFATDDISNFDFVYDRIVGNPDPAQFGKWPEYLRRVRQFMATRLMGQVGIAQLGETANPVAHLGLKSVFAHVPAAKRIVDDLGRFRLKDDFFDELEGMAIGHERIHGLYYNTIDQVGDTPFQPIRWNNQWTDRLDQVLSNAERYTYEFSGMSFIQQQQHRMVAAAVADKLARLAGKATLSEGELRRLAYLNIEPDMLARIRAQIDKHVYEFQGGDLNRKLPALNLQKWDDLEAKARLEEGIFKMVHKLIQSNDPTNMAFWMNGPLAQAIFQFRSFTLTAYANQFLWNLHIGDPRAYAAFAWTTAWNALVRAGQVSLLAAGRSDQQEYLEKNLDTWSLAKAGFQRSGWSSILPMLTDSALVLTGNEGMFDARSSGQPTDLIFGNPAGSAVDQYVRGIRGPRDMIVDGRQISQSEARALIGLLPFSNLMPFVWASNAMLQGLPEKAPPRNRN